jgi:hypothetical protein
MKVLVVWDTAGVLTPVAQWMNKNGHEMRVIMRKAQDQLGLTSSSGHAIMVDSPKELYREARRQIHTFKPDVIHVTSTIRGLLVVRLTTSRTPVIFTYNGSEVRGRKSAHAEKSLADKVTVSTQDLQQYGEWLDRPVHSMFYYRGDRQPNTALAFYNSNYIHDTRPMVKEWCDSRGVELTLIDRTDPANYIPHSSMPELFSRFEYYLDFKGHGKEQFALSRSALEAMACGCRIIHDSDLEKEVDPNDIKMVTPKDYLAVYESLKKPSLWRTIKRVPRIFSGLARWVLNKIP